MWLSGMDLPSATPFGAPTVSKAGTTHMYPTHACVPAHTSPLRSSAVLHGEGQTFLLLHSATLMKLTGIKGEGRTPVKVQGMR